MKKNATLNSKSFPRLLLRWFDLHGRKDLPWQKNKTPYRVWVSEIMLQQTQVSTVIAYFERFMTAFPDVHALANAREDDVLHLWTGLGYYQRARHLHKTAKLLIRQYHGDFPSEVCDLETLPGIGRSTAGAIRSIAFEKKAPILDGNVKRVLTRLHGITEWPGEKHVTEKLWKLAEDYSPSKRAADFSQAIMDLGATLCVRGQPRCDECPFEKYCIARKKGIEKQLPQAKPRKSLPTRKTIFLILRNGTGSVLLEKRPARGVWAGLWSFPEIETDTSVNEIKNTCRKRYKLSIDNITYGEPFRHTFSHYHLDIQPVFLKVAQAANRVMENDQIIWYTTRQSQRVGLPAPVKLLLSEITP